MENINVELQLEIKALEFTPHRKQANKCIEKLNELKAKRTMISQNEYFENSSQLQTGYNVLKQEIDTFFKLVLIDF